MLMQGLAWDDAADGGCDKVRLHPACRADTREGAEARLEMAGWVRPCSRNMLTSTTALRQSQCKIMLPDRRHAGNTS